MYHLYRLKRWVSISWTNKQSYKKDKNTNSIHLKRQYKIQTFLYMSNNNSSANIIINSMIHHSKLSLKGNNSKQTKKNFSRLRERSRFWLEGWFLWNGRTRGPNENVACLLAIAYTDIGDQTYTICDWNSGWHSSFDMFGYL